MTPEQVKATLLDLGWLQTSESTFTNNAINISFSALKLHIHTPTRTLNDYFNRIVPTSGSFTIAGFTPNKVNQAETLNFLKLP